MSVRRVLIATLRIAAVAGLLGAGNAALSRAQTLGRVYVANDLSRSISVVDTETGTTRNTIPVPGGPRDLAVSSQGERVYVAVREPDGIVVVDAVLEVVLTTIEHDSFDVPEAIALAPDDRTALIVNFGANALAVVDVVAGTVERIVPVGAQPLDVAVRADGTAAYIVNSADNTVTAVALPSGEVVATIPIGSMPARAALTADGGLLYVTNLGGASVSVISTVTNAEVDVIPVGLAPVGISLRPGASEMYVTSLGDDTVSVIDTSTNALKTTYPVGGGPFAVAFGTDPSFAYVTSLNLVQNEPPRPGLLSVIRPPVTPSVALVSEVGLLPVSAAIGPLPPPTSTGTAIPTAPTPEVTPTVVIACLDDQDCPVGRVCGPDELCVSAPTPTPTVACVEDDDCPIALACLSGVCRDPPTPGTPGTPTQTPTRTRTGTRTLTPTRTGTAQRTATRTAQPTPTCPVFCPEPGACVIDLGAGAANPLNPSAGVVRCQGVAPTSPVARSPTHTPSQTPSGSHTPTVTPTPSGTRTRTATPTDTPTPGPISPTPTPTGGPGPCCGPHAGVGCEERSCQSCVCASDRYCCERFWDRECADQAFAACAAECACTRAASTCCRARDEGGCNRPPCEQCVCELDDYCCSGLWDRACVDAAAGACAGDCECLAQPRVCVGDCDDDGGVTVDEILRGIGLVIRPAVVIDECPALDPDGDGTIAIDSLVLAVNNLLLGCPSD